MSIKIRIALVFMIPTLVGGFILLLTSFPDSFFGNMVGKMACPNGSVFVVKSGNTTVYDDGFARDAIGYSFDCQDTSGHHVENHIDLYFNLLLAIAIIAPLLSVLITLFNLPKAEKSQTGDNNS